MWLRLCVGVLFRTLGEPLSDHELGQRESVGLHIVVNGPQERVHIVDHIVHWVA